jgi:hypothetical protein
MVSIAVGAVNSSSGEAQVSVNWSLDCPYPADYVPPGHIWGVQIAAMNSAGAIVTGNSADYGGGESADTYGADANPNDSAHGYGLALMLDPNGPTTQAFQIVVTLQCNGMATTVDNKTVVLMRCGADPYTKADHEYAEFTDLSNIGEGELKKANKVLPNFVEDYAKELVELSPLKIGILKFIKKVGPKALPVTEFLATPVGIGVTLLNADLAWKDEAEPADGAKSDFAQADGFLDRANADLEQARAEGTACAKPLHDELNKLLAEQKLRDDARDEIDGWDRRGYYYVSPITNTLVDEGTALAQARAALAGGSGTRQTIIGRAATASTSADAAQLRAALSDIDTALADHATVNSDVGRLDSATQTLLARLPALLAS